MITMEPVEEQALLAGLKQQYLAETTAPLDGMWLCGFVPQAAHYCLMKGDQLVGFYCVNDQGYLLQVAIDERFRIYSSDIFEAVVASEHAPTGKIAGAFVSTAEPLYFSMCLDRFAQFEVNALMYELTGAPVSQPAALNLRAIEQSQLETAVEFCIESIGAPRRWLAGYLGGLVTRGELFGLWDEGELIATGESRLSHEHQAGYADLGVIVAPSQRGRGLATRVLQTLVARNNELGLRSICSTEKGNKAAQTAIGRAGFAARNRIVQFEA